jgi:hypothetical protein
MRSDEHEAVLAIHTPQDRELSYFFRGGFDDVARALMMDSGELLVNVARNKAKPHNHGKSWRMMGSSGRIVRSTVQQRWELR